MFGVIYVIGVFELFVVLVVLVQRLLLTLPARQRRLVARIAERVQLSTESAYEAGAAERIVRRAAVAITGRGVVMMAALPLLGLLPSTHHHTPFLTTVLIPWLILVANRPLVLTGLMVREVYRRRLPGPRVARLVAPVINDYVSPYTLWGTRLVAGVALPAIAVTTWVTQAPGGPEPMIASAQLLVITVVGPLVALAVEVVARRLLELPQPATSPLELQWDDALRALQVDQLYSATTLLGLVLCAYSASPLFASGPVWYGLGAAVFAVNVGAGPYSRYRQRLWQGRPTKATA